jgi:hypothetical protein
MSRKPFEEGADRVDSPIPQARPRAEHQAGHEGQPTSKTQPTPEDQGPPKIPAASEQEPSLEGSSDLENGTEAEDEDYSSYREGVEFEPLKKNIKILIVAKYDFIVFLDDDLCVHYWYSGRYEYKKLPKDSGKVLITESRLEAVSHELLLRRQKRVFRTMLGESLARLFDEMETANALAILSEAKDYLTTRSSELGRVYYLLASLGCTVLVLAIVLYLWGHRAWMLEFFGTADAVDVIVGIGMGTLGAFFSFLQRSSTLSITSSAGRNVYIVEAAMRAMAGGLGGFLVALAIKTGLLLAQVGRSDRPLLLLMLFCLVAGSSERAVPVLMKRFETAIDEGKKEPQVGNESSESGARSEGNSESRGGDTKSDGSQPRTGDDEK